MRSDIGRHRSNERCSTSKIQYCPHASSRLQNCGYQRVPSSLLKDLHLGIVASCDWSQAFPGLPAGFRVSVGSSTSIESGGVQTLAPTTCEMSDASQRLPARGRPSSSARASSFAFRRFLQLRTSERSKLPRDADVESLRELRLPVA